MENSRGRISTFMTAFVITVMIIIGAFLFMTALYRMENTISPNGYKLFEIQKIEKSGISMTVMNTTYIFNYNEAIEQIKPYLKYDYLVPAEVRSFFYTVGQIVGTACDYSQKLLE